MATLPRGFLQKKDGQWRMMRLLDVVTLLYNVHRGAQTDEVGFEDAMNTLEAVTRRLNKKTLVDPQVLESCLWSCNLLNERGQFWHPRGYTFDQFLKDILQGDEFDKDYNLIKKREKK